MKKLDRTAKINGYKNQYIQLCKTPPVSKSRAGLPQVETTVALIIKAVAG